MVALLVQWLVCTRPWVQSRIWEMAHTCNPSTQEVDAGGSRIQDQPWVDGEKKERARKEGRKEEERKEREKRWTLPLSFALNS